MRRLLTVIIVAFAVGAAAGLALLIVSNPPGTQKVTSSGKALIGGPFTMTDQNGNKVTDKDFRGRYMLVFFGYTHCPDVCPAELQVMAQAYDKLDSDEKKKLVPVFVSVDPERDTPEALKAYLANFGPEFVGLTGSDKEIANIAKQYRVVYSIHKENPQDEDYAVDHSAIAYLMGPDGEFVDHFTYGMSAPKLAENLKRYL